MLLVESLLKGNRRALARAITLVENDDQQKVGILQKLYPHTGKAYVIGVTGSPGAGKSSLVDQLLREARRENLSVGVIAVDPTSPFTGGAILGDRIRMQEHALDPGVFIRSVGSRGSLGGLSRSTWEIIQILDAFGKDLVMVETVGVGQSEVDIVKAADTTLVVLTPAAGDSVQTIKAGIMEIADVFVINKADLPGVERIFAEVNAMLDLKQEQPWRPPVIQTVCTLGHGLKELWESIAGHRRYLSQSNRLHEERQARVRMELIGEVEYLLKREVWRKIKSQASLPELVQQIADRRQDPYSAARELLNLINFQV
ncbi:MAG TPA: methylmalonyl Co-A mutase-associated GTPase MeaB [Firmicutes bacterium]|nr:methylmalonyl Co-A mutase-associated GTPase MeaB [Bacillota bacterium]